MNGIKRSLSRLGPLYDDEKLRKWDVRERLYWDRTYPSTQSLTKPVSAPAASCSINSISPFDQPVVSVSPLSVQVRPRPDCHVYDVIVDVHNRGCMSSSVKADQIEPIRGNDTIHMNSSKEGAKIGTPAIPEQIFATTPQIVTYLHAQDGNALFSSYFKFGLPPKHFPHFTLWLSFVQLLVFVIALCLFGMSSFGPGYNRRIPGRVLMPNLVVDHVCRIEPRSVLLAQRLTDLIRLGARFAPCMRPDPLFTDHVVERQKRWDRASGCCVRNDGGGCYQTRRDGCSHLLSTWLRYDSGSARTVELGKSFSDNVIVSERNSTDLALASTGSSNAAESNRSGPVCGLDPEFCLSPRSSSAFTWSKTDVTQWPICKIVANRSNLAGFAQHMECKVTGRPCCVGITGECIITTQEHCNFVRGIYNPMAALCSQVNCLEQTCGMWGFADHRSPDQGYRVILSIFIHTNLPHLFLSLLIQLFALRPFEEYMGWHKMAVMFISSCIFGNFLSSFVHPYQIATGPAHMGLLTVRLVDFLCFQHLLEKSRSGIMHMVLPLIFLLFLGFSPWLDNVANFGSVLIALLLYFILIYHTRCILRILLTCGLTGLFIMVCMLFYRGPIVQCEWCRHLTCAPLTPGLCDEFQVSVETQLDCIPLNWE